MKILIVDDEPELLAQIEGVLAAQRYDVETSADGEAALDRIFTSAFDLILLDIMLPAIDGLTVLSDIRQAGIKTPVLMLTAKGDVDDRIEGLDRGADDYLAKPFSMDELLARIRALFRRASAHAVPVLKVENIMLNTVSREVNAGSRPLKLTPKEFSILEFLLYNTNRVVSRFSLSEHLWGEDFDPFSMSNSIDVHIRNLRRKIGDSGGSIIQTVRGLGYIIRDGEP